jgi:hypothetical protein
VDFSNSKDERLLSFYENIRSQVEAERYFAYRFTTGSVRQYAERLREEMDRRRLIYTAIKWDAVTSDPSSDETSSEV